MADYQLTASEHSIIRNLDGACIPDDPANTDYQEYLKWIEAGGVPDPYAPPPEVPPQADPQTTTLYDHENRLRAIEGQPPLAIGDFITQAYGA